MAQKFTSFTHGMSGDIKEILVGDETVNAGIPGGSYIPSVLVKIITAGGMVYSGSIRVNPILEHLKKLRP